MLDAARLRFQSGESARTASRQRTSRLAEEHVKVRRVETEALEGAIRARDAMIEGLQHNVRALEARIEGLREEVRMLEYGTGSWGL